MAHASVCRDVNRYIRETAAYLSPAAESVEHAFLCVCGCSERVRMTLAQYDACGGEALLGGHVAPAREPATTLVARPGR